MDKKALLSLLSRCMDFSVKKNDLSISVKADHLVLLTAAGQITGVPVPLANEEDSSASVNEAIGKSFFISMATTYKEKYNERDFILLKDATLFASSGNRFSYNFLYVFTGDVIAATIAECGSN